MTSLHPVRRIAALMLLPLLATACSRPSVAVPGDAAGATLVTVSAQAEARRAPDVAMLSTGVVTQGADARGALRENARRMEAVVAALRAAGIAAKDIQTSGVSLSPDYHYVAYRPPRIRGYHASNTVNVVVRDIGRLGQTLDALVDVGANQVNGPMFDIEDKDAVLDEARGKALAKARACRPVRAPAGPSGAPRGEHRRDRRWRAAAPGRPRGDGRAGLRRRRVCADRPGRERPVAGPGRGLRAGAVGGGPRRVHARACARPLRGPRVGAGCGRRGGAGIAYGPGAFIARTPARPYARPTSLRARVAMLRPTPPADDAERVADLHSYDILEAPADPAFDRIAQLAAMICGTERASITLIDHDRQWFRANHGFDAVSIPREDGICGHALAHEAFFEVPDVEADPRFAGNPVLRAAQVRFYGGSRLVNPRGHALGMLCVHDSSPRTLDAHQKRALDHLAATVVALMEAHRRGRRLAWFGRLVDEVSDELYVLDAETWRYLHANRTSLEHLGYSLDELRLRTPVDITPSLTATAFAEYVARLEAGEAMVTHEGVRRRADGSTYDVEVRLRRVTTSQRPVIVSQACDITERRAMARIKDEFVAVVSHELRTPLTAIHGALRLLATGAAGELPESAAHLVGIASDGSSRLRAIVDDILDLEQIAAGRMQFARERIEAEILLHHVADAFAASAAHWGITLSVDAAPGLQVLGDERRLQQVLGNLVSNALKFSPRGSVVTLASEPLDGAVRLSVTDRGPGVPEAFRARIFQRFAQADMGSARPTGGSGLGLSIVRRMTEQMDGQAGFESEPGHTRFHIDLPVPTE